MIWLLMGWPTAANNWTAEYARYDPASLRVRLVWVGNPDRGETRHMVDIFQMMARGFGASPEHVASVFFNETNCGPLGVAGVTAAHREVWKRIVGCSSGCATLRCYIDERVECAPANRSDWTVVIEDDAILHPNAAAHRDLYVREVTRQLVMATEEGADLVWLGYCGNRKPERMHADVGWLCTHAYAATERAACSLLEHVRLDCKTHARRPAVDWQMHDLCSPKRRKEAHYLPRTARLNCSGVHDTNPLFDWRPPSTIASGSFYKPGTHGLIFQTTRPSIRRSIDQRN